MPLPYGEYEESLYNYKERHALCFKYFIAFLRYIRMIRRSPDSIYKLLMLHMVSILPKITLKFHVKYQLLGTLSGQET